MEESMEQLLKSEICARKIAYSFSGFFKAAAEAPIDRAYAMLIPYDPYVPKPGKIVESLLNAGVLDEASLLGWKYVDTPGPGVRKTANGFEVADLDNIREAKTPLVVRELCPAGFRPKDVFESRGRININMDAISLKNLDRVFVSSMNSLSTPIEKMALLKDSQLVRGLQDEARILADMYPWPKADPKSKEVLKAKQKFDAKCEFVGRETGISQVIPSGEFRDQVAYRARLDFGAGPYHP
jgi:hypothetical protein